MTMRRVFIAVGLLALMALGALWQPHDPDAIDLASRFSPLTISHPLGTDHLGRDLLARLMVGGWRTAIVVLTVALVGIIGGCLFGTTAALVGGWGEAVILRTAETSIVIPTLIIALTAAAIFGLRPAIAELALGLAGIGPYTLFAHALSRRIVAQPYVHAARALGVSDGPLILRHVVPNILPAVLTHVGSNAGLAVTAYASLAFLGLGADPSRPDWGWHAVRISDVHIRSSDAARLARPRHCGHSGRPQLNV
jgi:peptide/nickel transport system permease protein